MRKALLASGVVLCLMVNLYAQQVYTTQKEVFETKGMVFYGYDYTNFMLVDAKRMTFKSLFFKDNIRYNNRPTLLLNQKTRTENLWGRAKHIFSEDSVQSMISRYFLSEKEGIGFVMIVECFDEPTKNSHSLFYFF